MNNKANKTSFKKGHGRIRTDESYKKAGIKISLAKTGKARLPPTIETRLRLSQAMKNRKITWGDKISRVKAGDNYGFDLKQRYVRKLEKKAGKPKPDICEVCKRGGRIYYDHNHATGLFRGWLCVKCNNTLGLVSDTPKILRDLAKYVTKHSRQRISH